jgi:UDP-glucose 4-epimerase
LKGEVIDSSRILVTGASGFIGSTIVSYCEEAGFHVVATGRAKTSELETNYQSLDLITDRNLSDIFEGIDSVIHCAGIAHQFDKSNRESEAIMTDNVRMTENLVKAVIKSKVRRLIYLSSVSVYGKNKNHDESATCYPDSPYAVSKYQSEQLLLSLTKPYSIQTIILRPATVYGEGDPGNVSRLISSIYHRKFMWIGNGSNRKSLIHKDDVASACVRTLLSKRSDKDLIYNLSGSIHTMAEIVETIAELLEKQLPRFKVPSTLALSVSKLGTTLVRDHEPFGTVFNTIKKWLMDDVYPGDKFLKDFQFANTISLKEGLEREVEWFVNRHE